ncbi:hypothetical protein E4U43_002957 [Claviceps pusilla]|uniref:Uncharacterized protein n=1 Tax=Claviceps pusilla TaxID=123648 RepID=A0A9P7N685_9HYPO|nr:hypothetical protein E4U43_002957 [Claviceps pusilla]
MIYETGRGHVGTKCIDPTIQMSGTEQGIAAFGHHLGRRNVSAIIQVAALIEAEGESSVCKLRI